MGEFLRNNLTLVKILFAIVLVILLIGSVLIAKKLEGTKTRSEKIKKYSTIAIFSGLSVLLYYLRIPFPIFTFLKLQLSSLPAYIIGFLLGPASGVMVILIRAAITIPFTHSMCVGELADLCIGVAATLTSSIVYLKHKTKGRAAASLVFASVAWVITAILANIVLLLPFYIKLMFNDNLTGFVSMLASSVPSINEDNYMLMYVLIGVIPFNLIMTVVSSIVTFIVYKSISKLYHNIAKEDNSKEENLDNSSEKE